jgi:hypothetical protein
MPDVYHAITGRKLERHEYTKWKPCIRCGRTLYYSDSAAGCEDCGSHGGFFCQHCWITYDNVMENWY